ncbi:FCD domain-containing protein [Novosphingobium sp. BL-8H]|uniref:GntR family transcriptional regulator n=1 Tax=Novosphingobium sp. BL-8H TaxID=3127640 RepID=UPI00375819F8
MIGAEENLAIMPGSPKSQTSMAYESIRNDIIAGLHEPGKKLKIQDLAAELGVAPGAVREALSRLVPEELVISRDQRGFVVAPLSIDDLVDLTDLRCEIEAIALRRSVANGDVDWEVRLISAAHRLRALPHPVPGKGMRSDATTEWLQRHAEFHAALVSACGSRRLMALHAQLYEQSERYRVMSALVETHRNVGDEHQHLVDLALARDADRLVELMSNHIRLTTDLIVEAAKTTAVA